MLNVKVKKYCAYCVLEIHTHVKKLLRKTELGSSPGMGEACGGLHPIQYAPYFKRPITQGLPGKMPGRSGIAQSGSGATAHETLSR
jgi:hypothetical protein